jgi:hypothetical protein
MRKERVVGPRAAVVPSKHAARKAPAPVHALAAKMVHALALRPSAVRAALAARNKWPAINLQKRGGIPRPVFYVHR